jgi:GT2 family glycosyltransferase
MNMLAHVVRNRRDIHLFFINEKQTILEVGRHRLVMNAMAIKADYILWVDTDMQFSYDTLTRLIDADKDVIGLQALMRAHPYASNAYDLEGNQVLYPDNIVEVKYIGTGLLLTKVEVFTKIGMPYFKTTYTEGHWQGEDLNFCDRVRAAGYKIYCHGPLSKSLFHLGVKKYGHEPQTK